MILERARDNNSCYFFGLENRKYSSRIPKSDKGEAMIKRFPLLMSLLAVTLVGYAADAPRHVPTLDDLLTIKSVGGTQISPDGRWVAYTINYGDFKQDAFITQICLV